VVFDELRKFYGKFFATLKTRDFYQMAGRAGRRGIDVEGFVYSRINPRFIRFDELKRVIYNEPEKVHSRFNASYATVLNLYEKHRERLYDIYPTSFHYFQAKLRKQEKALKLLESKVTILKDLGYIKDNRLTEKGNFGGKIYGYELSLTEIYEKGILEQFSEKELGKLALALVYEPKKGVFNPKLTRRERDIQDITDNTVRRIQSLEKKHGIMPLSKIYHFHLSACLEAWMNGEDFDKILKHGQVDEGELIRYFRMAIQILREILDTHISPELKRRIKNALALINRGIIDAEKQLRT